MSNEAYPPLAGTELSEEARASALRAGRAPVPPKFIGWMVVAFMVLGFGGIAVEHYFGNIGASTTVTRAVTNSTNPLTSAQRRRQAALDQFIGFKPLGGSTAYEISLRTQSNTTWTSADAKGRVLVLSFDNVNCNDICPVLGNEIRQARTLLGAEAQHVVFALVNTDPTHLTYTSQPRALTEPHLAGLAATYFLTGTLHQLNPVWINYGVNIKVGFKANQIAHNNVIYFIDALGHLRALAVPFGNESYTGLYSLGNVDVHRFAEGIAMVASSLVK